MEMKITPEEYKILIVDDVISNVLLLKVLLKGEKYTIVTANNGTEALRQVEAELPDLILLDVMMPDLSGFEVAESLKRDERYSEIPLIFLTALNGTADIVKGFQVGGNDFISKPFNKEELLIRVKHQISLIAAKRIIMAQKEELQRTIMGRDKLYSIIAHDLRSPMGSIKMVLNMLTLSLPAEVIGEEMFDLLNSANQTTEELFSLLDNLLKWTKSQVGRLNVVYQEVDIRQVVQGVIEIFTMVGELKKISIQLVDSPEEATVRADADMIKTVVRNLISNAIKFSHENSVVQVCLKEEDGFVVVSVKDSGCGMDEAQQRKLLHTDTHFSTFGTKNEEGSGLGLLLCLDFVQKNGGKLWFESTKGVGSTFYFSIPLKKSLDLL
ncbi:MAG: hybrid sensor histidine kinase/response regulator [Bacteroidia bacterium]|nr:hybrid sensor histidine kinase/response regulator [Bacteroidia bacterium]